jgi:hypothetical protein
MGFPLQRTKGSMATLTPWFNYKYWLWTSASRTMRGYISVVLNHHIWYSSYRELIQGNKWEMDIQPSAYCLAPGRDTRNHNWWRIGPATLPGLPAHHQLYEYSLLLYKSSVPCSQKLLHVAYLTWLCPKKRHSQGGPRTLNSFQISTMLHRHLS